MDVLRRVYTGSECRQIDQIAIDEFGISSFRLMYRAAMFAMSELLSRWPNPSLVSIVCGSGNNAGDGYLLAASLQSKNIAVQLIQVGDATRLKGDAKRAFEQVRALGIEPSPTELPKGEVVVDALLGTGVQGDVRPRYAEMIERINAAGKSVVSLDLPSGIHPDTGGLLVEEPVRARLTTCFVAPKVSLLTGRARSFAGEIVSSTLDIPEAAYAKIPGAAVLPTNEAERVFASRELAGHKRDFGHVLVVAGNAGMGGAGLLAASASLRASAGLVSVSTHPEHAAAYLTSRPELMVSASSDGHVESEKIDRADVIVVGPGLGRDAWAERAFTDVLASGKPLVVDADALNRLADDGLELPQGSVITPHPGEAARILKSTTQEIESDRIGAAKALSARLNAVAVLKGAGTLIAENDRLHGICDVAEPALGTAGSGDVLAGIIGAALAQNPDSVTAAALGVHLHAEAGLRVRNESGGKAVVAMDLIEALRPWG